MGKVCRKGEGTEMVGWTGMVSKDVGRGEDWQERRGRGMESWTVAES